MKAISRLEEKDALIKPAGLTACAAMADVVILVNRLPSSLAMPSDKKN